MIDPTVEKDAKACSEIEILMATYLIYYDIYWSGKNAPYLLKVAKEGMRDAKRDIIKYEQNNKLRG